MAEEAVEIDAGNVQGLVFAGWGKSMPFAAFLFVNLHDGADARAWLGALDVTSGVREGRRDDVRIQVALSDAGLAALGVEESARARFPQELQLGMAARKRVIGDCDASDPANWSLLREGTRCDAVAMLYATTEDGRTALVDEHKALVARHHGEVVGLELSAKWREKEQFGFADGLSQPFMQGHPGAQPRPGQHTIATGEILLGYQNQYSKMPQSPVWRGFDLGRDGTFVVFRKLHQDATGFWNYFRERGRELAGQKPVPADPEEAAVWLASRALGRWPSGASLVQTPHFDDPRYAHPDHVNTFGYLSEDPDGTKCPIASHVRRANPRDDRGGGENASFEVVDRHRILRRGRAYGAFEGEGDRGLLFISLQASIARGFEFIQQTWNINPNFRGVFDETDPVIGPGGGHFSIPCPPLRLRLNGIPRFTTTRGGGYFFLPSIRAIHHLAGR